MNEYFIPLMAFISASIWISPVLAKYYGGRANLAIGAAWACAAAYTLWS